METLLGLEIVTYKGVKGSHNVYRESLEILTLIKKDKNILPPYRKRILFWIRFGLTIGNINHE